MEIGLIGAGKMGFNLIGNFLDKGFQVYVHDINKETLSKVSETYQVPTYDELSDFLNHRKEKRIIWVMLPAGEITYGALEKLLEELSQGDVVIEGGNSNPKDSKKIGMCFQQKGIYIFDVGTSGGTYGARHGASYMIGGDSEKFKEIEEIFRETSKKEGYIYVGKNGAGHFLKIVHNAILYGYMQTLSEGFSILEQSEYDYDLSAVADSWAQTSVVRGWLLELASQAFSKDPKLEEFTGKIGASRSTNWVMDFAMENKIAIPVISTALFARYKSQDEDKFSEKMISALRKEVGGNTEKK